jgi:hypothetical protein
LRGDDIGWWNISYNSRGADGLTDTEHRPNRRRSLH